MKTMHIHIYAPKDVKVYLVFWGTNKENMKRHFRSFHKYLRAWNFAQMQSRKYERAGYKIDFKTSKG